MLKSAIWFVGGSEPNDREEGLGFLLGLLNEFDGLLNNNLRAFTSELGRRGAVVRKMRVQFEKIVMGQPLIESHRARVGGGIRFDRADVPFA